MRLPVHVSTLLVFGVFPAFFAAGCRAEPDEVIAAPVRPAAAPAAKKPTQPLPPCEADKDPALSAPFTDGFDRAELGDDWRSTSYGAYFLKAGRLCISKPRNHPLWLKRKLPANVRVEFEAMPTTNNADIKAELFGDGCAFDQDGRDYTATAYVGVLGAHNNSEHWLARMFEHGPEAKKTPLVAGGASIATSKLILNTVYHVEFARTDGKTVTLKVDGVTIHEMTDPQPLTGVGHDHFGFNGWDAPSCFDKVTITPL